MQISCLSMRIKPDQQDHDAPGLEVYDLIDGDWEKIRTAMERLPSSLSSM